MENRLEKNQNLINEYKGHLLEYLVSLELAKEFSLLPLYIDSIPKDLHQRLSFYQEELQNRDFSLFKKLPLIAKNIATHILPKIPLKKIHQIYTVGKTTQFNNTFPEADIVLEGENEKNQHCYLPIGLKFCRIHSYVNTKNAGIKSFLSRYFSSPSSLVDQAQLNKEYEGLFFQMGQSLYQKHDCHFLGTFLDKWHSWGYSDLPGKLPKELQHIISHYYSQTIQIIYEKILAYQKNNPEQFCKDLYPLLGIGHEDLLQVFCFHEGTNLYEISQICVMEAKDYEIAQGVEIHPVRDSLSFFEIHLHNKTKAILQIRVKPMNKFTTPNVKINCSVKYTALSS